MLRLLFSPFSRENDEVSGLVQAALTGAMDESSQLRETIREMLEENDRITGRKKHAEKPHG